MLGENMTKKKRFLFLSEEFYLAYPPEDYPKMEQKHNRPYIQVYVEIEGIQYAIPLRSDIHHPHVLWTDKKNHCSILKQSLEYNALHNAVTYIVIKYPILISV
ncbi:hypothetical protein [Anaerosporobacter sp.]|uniref:hypothetical protein n=1 Tax=Anaerosporobacter sp. TaxID=1872529 RepID=UPI00286F9DE5|nr:hypothetical protein [Anaerosporobacter sp.]